MSTALALPSTSALPASISSLLQSPTENSVEQLYWSYKAALKNLQKAHELLDSGLYINALDLLTRSAGARESRGFDSNLSNRNIGLALKLLMQDYWEKAIAITDVKTHMPQKRKTEWRESIENFDFPDFTLENVYDTLRSLLLERDKFVAEKVDGLFNNLSKEHLTNNPAGFSKRMILADVHDGHYPCSTKSGYIQDLRAVVAQLMKREVSNGNNFDTYDAVRYLMKDTGNWVDMDGGAIRIKVFKKGTAHIEIHPDISYQLNQILTLLYPASIPSEFRTKPKKQPKNFHLSYNLISLDVLHVLKDVKRAAVFDANQGRFVGTEKGFIYEVRHSYGVDKHLQAKAVDVLEAIGGVALSGNRIEFEYDPSPVIEKIIVTGSLPDKVSHQYYPTPTAIVEKMIAKLPPVKKYLEPSAGTGNIALKLKGGSVTCVEVSELHCAILKERGCLNVIKGDFIEVSKTLLASNNTFDGVVMNPPFSLGRALLHVQAALSVLDEYGTLVALVPYSLKNKLSLPPSRVASFEAIEGNEFKGVRIELAIMQIKPACK